MTVAAPTPQPTQAPTPRPAAVIHEADVINHDGTHLTSKGECWWKISDLWYDDPFQWTILYKRNRDYIPEPGNPDLITAGDLYYIPLNVNDHDKDAARKQAMAYDE